MRDEPITAARQQYRDLAVGETGKFYLRGRFAYRIFQLDSAESYRVKRAIETQPDHFVHR
ncbi:hypothetical protein MTY66_51110 [Mycolicibacterium sp. TY66]|nr:hypothetical protein MTY66_51110 [Mycolicibacterium sp. TY66]BCJ78870.1 hypothetical protein MTY81_02430 [Mycolicibacterium sp. TY81]